WLYVLRASMAEPSELPVQRAVLDRFGHGRDADAVFTGEVGDGAGELEDPVVGPRRETEAADGKLEQLLRLRLDLAEGLHLPAVHRGVDEDGAALEAPRLDVTRGGHPGADLAARLALSGRQQLVLLEARDLDVDVD